MSDYIKKIKDRALGYTLVGLSLFGGINKAQAQDDNSNMSVVHSGYVTHNETFKSYHESVSVSLDDKTYLMSNNVIMYSIGDGYNIMHESSSVNGKLDTNSKMISPDGRLIDISFYNEKDFMLPAYIADVWSSNRREVINDSVRVKENNDRWEKQQRIAAMQRLKNPNDREAFYKYIKQNRYMLENAEKAKDCTGSLAQQQVNGFIEDGYVSTSQNIDRKDLRKIFKKIKKQMKNSSEILTEKALNGDVTQIATIKHLWTNQGIR